jgi:hypothetical protein
MLTTRIFQNLFVIICLFGALQSVAQVERAALTGKVVGANSREPVFSATVCVKGSETSGVLTDAEGSFRLEIQPGKRILVIRMIGYAPFEKAIQVAPGEVQEIVDA